MTRRVFTSNSSPSADKAVRWIPGSRNGQILLGLGALVLAAILAGVFMKPPSLAKRQPPKATAEIVSNTAQWPLTDVSAMIVKANRFMRSKWVDDAVLMEVDVKPGPAGFSDPTLTYYSPSLRHVRSLSPASAAGAMGEPRVRDNDTRRSIPDHVLDLPAALGRAGLQANDIEEADLGWTNGGCGSRRCPPGSFEGIQWRLMVKKHDSRYVPATQ